MSDALWTIVFVGGLALLIWLGWRYEPHWSSKDGRRFTCRTRPLVTDRYAQIAAQRDMANARAAALTQMLGMGGRASATPTSRWRDAKAFVDDDGHVLQIITKLGPVRRPLPPARVFARGDVPQHRRWVYLVDTDPVREVRVPVSSRAVPVLDELVARSTGNRPPAAS